MNIVLAGGTGFIGKSLVDELVRRNHRIVLLTRRASAQKKNSSVTPVEWDGKTQGKWTAFVDGSDAVINLCGESVAAKRWDPEQKKRILSSRVDPAKALAESILSAKKKPAVYIQASGSGYYGDRGPEILTETAGPGNDFLAETCVQWEGAAAGKLPNETRIVFARFGAVLEKDGGAIRKMLPPFRFFLGGPLGSGNQWMPWIHRDDAVGILIYALTAENLRGPVNGTAPETVTMKKFAQTMGECLKRPSWMPVPSGALKILMGEAAELLLNSQRAIPAALMRSGYQFRYPHLKDALSAIIRNE